MAKASISAVLFDFGGVLADEGFRNGLTKIAIDSGLDPQEFFENAQKAIFSSGYLIGHGTESSFWNRLRTWKAFIGEDIELREIILKGFILRQWMVDIVEKLKNASIRTAILSDQTNWLDELEERLHFSSHFERVFNSFHLGKSKADPGIFTDVLASMGLMPEETLFIDDTLGHVERARSKGLYAIHFQGREQFMKEMRLYFPVLLP